MTTVHHPVIDVVIPTHNRPERLRLCLEAMAQQTLRHFRVIVVDDASDEPVEAALPASLRQQLDLTVVRLERNSGPAHARNVGVATGSAAHIAFIDDDVVADPELLERLIGAMDRLRTPSVPVAVIGTQLAPADWRPRPWTLWEAQKLAGLYDDILARRYNPTWRQFFTGNTLVRREHFERAGGFDERFTRAEDIELGVRLQAIGVRVALEPRAVGWHHADRTLASWRRIPGDYARFDVAIDAIYPHLERLAEVTNDLRRRNALEVVAGAIFGRRGMRVVGAGSSLAAARVLWALHLRAASMRSYSLAYNIEYRAALREARRNPAAVFTAAPGASAVAAARS